MIFRRTVYGSIASNSGDDDWTLTPFLSGKEITVVQTQHAANPAQINSAKRHFSEIGPIK